MILSALKKLDANLEKWLMFLLLSGMTLVLGIQISSKDEVGKS